jgi:hypothetical protein
MALTTLAMLVVLGFAVLSRSWTEHGSGGWLVSRDPLIPFVSAPPPAPPANGRSEPELVKAFAEVDGRLYRIIVATRPEVERRAVLWSAAVTDDEGG